MAATPTQPKPGEPIKLIETNSGWRYRARIDVGCRPDGTRQQQSRTFSTLTETRGWVASIKTDRSRGVLAPTSQITLNELADAWLRSMPDLKHTTIDDYAHHLKKVRARWGHRKAATLGRREIQDLVHELRTDGGKDGIGLGFDSVRKTRLALKLVLDYGVDIEAIPKNVATNVTVAKRRIDERANSTVWSPAQMNVFRQIADNHRLAPAWRLTLCGLRRGEVLALQWGDIDLETGKVTISRRLATLSGVRQDIDTPKSAASKRTVDFEDIQPGTVALLKAMKAEITAAYEVLNAEPPVWIFTDHLGRTLRTDHYSKAFAVVCAESNLPKIRLHDIRQSLATALHEAGAVPAAAAALLGHDVQTHLRTYVKLNDGGPTAAAKVLGAALHTTP